MFRLIPCDAVSSVWLSRLSRLSVCWMCNVDTACRLNIYHVADDKSSHLTMSAHPLSRKSTVCVCVRACVRACVYIYIYNITVLIVQYCNRNHCNHPNYKQEGGTKSV